MTTITKWSNVQISIQSALGAVNTISAISKASPGVVTASSAVNTGDFVRMDNIVGMSRVNDRVYRASAASSNGFTLEGEDTTLYDTFTSGSARVVTFGTFMATVRGLTASGGDYTYIDITTVHDNIQKQIPGRANAASYQLDNLWDASDAALVALKTAADNESLIAIKLGFAGGAGAKVVFLGYVGATLLPTGTAQDVVVTPVTITMFGRPVIYSS